MTIRNRIRSLRRVKAGTLLANPLNWRRHTEQQREAMTGLLEAVGIVGTVLAYSSPDGLVIIDGHLRADIDPEHKVPVLVTDLTEEEAKIVLATYDKIGEMAGLDQAKLDELLNSCSSDDQRVSELLESLESVTVELIEDEKEDGEGDADGDGGEQETDGLSDPEESDKENSPDTLTEHIYFRYFEVPLSKDQADAFSKAIDDYTNETGTSHGFVTRIAEGL